MAWRENARITVLSVRDLTIDGDFNFGPYGSGDSYYVDGANGQSFHNGKTAAKAVNTLVAGEALLTANQNDVLYLIGNATGQTLASTLAWDKNYTHLHGICSPLHTNSRARVEHSGSTGNSPLMTISASGCSFRNLYFFQGSSAADTRCIDVTGERNYFNRVHFAGMGHATAGADVPACSLKLTGSENLFEDCTIGLDTIVRAAANAELLLDGGATRNMFRNCRFISASETSTKLMVKLEDTTAIDRYLIFENCLFYNFSVNHANTLAAAFAIPASCQTHDIILKNCLAVGIDEWEANDRGSIWMDMGKGTAEDGGIAVEPINT